MFSNVECVLRPQDSLACTNASTKPKPETLIQPNVEYALRPQDSFLSRTSKPVAHIQRPARRAVVLYFIVCSLCAEFVLAISGEAIGFEVFFCMHTHDTRTRPRTYTQTTHIHTASFACTHTTHAHDHAHTHSSAKHRQSRTTRQESVRSSAKSSV